MTSWSIPEKISFLQIFPALTYILSNTLDLLVNNVYTMDIFNAKTCGIVHKNAANCMYPLDLMFDFNTEHFQSQCLFNGV